MFYYIGTIPSLLLLAGACGVGLILGHYASRHCNPTLAYLDRELDKYKNS